MYPLNHAGEGREEERGDGERRGGEEQGEERGREGEGEQANCRLLMNSHKKRTWTHSHIHTVVVLQMRFVVRPQIESRHQL